MVYGGEEDDLFELFKISWLQEPNYLHYIDSIEEDRIHYFSHLQKSPLCLHKPFSLLAKSPAEEEKQEEEKSPEDLGSEEVKRKEKQLKLRGNNQIPLIHIEDLLMFIKALLLEEFKDSSYVVAIDFN